MKAGRSISFFAASALITVIVIACGSDRPGAGPGGTTPPTGGGACATPTEGCPCSSDGASVACGVETYREGDFVRCAKGDRVCTGGQWGVCIVSGTNTKYFAGGMSSTKSRFGLQGIRPQALGDGGLCQPGVNDCDPYCNNYVDDADGLVVDAGFSATDAGLTVEGAGGLVVGTFTSTATGDSNCGGASDNLHIGGACNADPYNNCKQDFRCDTTTNTCKWNSGAGYYDSTCAGFDVSLGAPCGAGGSARPTVPLCNRGSQPIPEGTVLNFFSPNSPPADACVQINADASAPECTVTVPTGGIPAGQCLSFGYCANSTGNKVMVVQVAAGSGGTGAECPGRCANNVAFYRTDGPPNCAQCGVTTVSGTVYDPSGAGAGTNNLPLAGIEVFESTNYPLPSFTPVDGQACDSCATLRTTMPRLGEAVTGADGTFTVNVTPGTTQLAIQSGRWRRTITLPTAAAAFTDNTYAAGTFRMPRNRTEGDIPKTAVVTGNQESLACMLLKIGIDASEVTSSATAASRIHVYNYNGMNTSPGASTSTTLYDSNLPNYTAVLMDCPANSSDKNSTRRTALNNYVNAGGRVFADHWAGDLMLDTAEFPATATWGPSGVIVAADMNFAPGLTAARGKILVGSYPQQLFSDWLDNVSATTDYGSGWIRVDQPRANAVTPAVTGTVEWIRGDRTNNWATPAGNYSLSYSYETPYGGTNCGTANGTGRVIYNGMHVAPGRGTTGTFSSGCNLAGALAPEEKALEYQIFQLTACQLGGATTITTTPPLATGLVFTRDYEGVCPVGTQPEWTFFEWLADAPPGTSVDLAAITLDDPTTFPAYPPAPIPPASNSVDVGPINDTNASLTVWNNNGSSVEDVLQARAGTTAVQSKRWLRVYMTFNTTAGDAVLIQNWRQLYSCVPAE